MYVPYVASRDVSATIGAFIKMMKSINWREENFISAVTTGAAVGLAGLAAARLHRVPAYYFESVSRVNGPSLTGRLASIDPWIHTYCQYQNYATGRWKFRSPLLDSFEAISAPVNPHPRLFVTLGTIVPYRFDALVDGILETGLADARTVWQLGSTERRSLPGRTVTQLSAAEFDQCVQEADIVITHAGVGTVMHLLEMGIYPVVVPRRANRREHVDDHQVQISMLITAREIGAVCDAEKLNRQFIIDATSKRIKNTK